MLSQVISNSALAFSLSACAETKLQPDLKGYDLSGFFSEDVALQILWYVQDLFRAHIPQSISFPMFFSKAFSMSIVCYNCYPFAKWQILIHLLFSCFKELIPKLVCPERVPS